MIEARVIRAENLGKRYFRGRQHDLSSSFREMVSAMPRRAVARFRRGAAFPHAEHPGGFWALRHLNLDVGRGELLGLIGPNGAGKSTLLRVLSRITRPTEGRAWVRGRVRALLEVGTGFHPELTGRENIYLNGVVLGMRKREIDRKFDEIVSFAEVGDFLDTPIKRYSTGMYVRLGFSVAAHLEPEILLVDEVLAVGDVRFQKRCIGKIESVTGQGRTVIFVSHNMQMIRRLCTRTVWIDGGEIRADGSTPDVVAQYLGSVSKRQALQSLGIDNHSVHRGNVDIVGVEFVDGNGAPLDWLLVDQPFSFKVTLRIRDTSERYKIDLQLREKNGTLVASLFSLNDGLPLIEAEGQQLLTVVCRSRNVLLGGEYGLDVYVRSADGTVVALVEGISYHVQSVSIARSLELHPGLVRLDADWSVEPLFSDETTTPSSTS